MYTKSVHKINSNRKQAASGGPEALLPVYFCNPLIFKGPKKSPLFDLRGVPLSTRPRPRSPARGAVPKGPTAGRGRGPPRRAVGVVGNGRSWGERPNTLWITQHRARAPACPPWLRPALSRGLAGLLPRPETMSGPTARRFILAGLRPATSVPATPAGYPGPGPQGLTWSAPKKFCERITADPAKAHQSPPGRRTNRVRR